MKSPFELTFHIISLGCSKNQTESEKIKSALQALGLEEAEAASDSDILIINTCGFIEDAKKESIEVIFDSLDYKNEKKESDFTKKIVVLGCFSHRYFQEVKKEIPEIDFIYGNLDDDFIPSMFQEFNISYNKVKNDSIRLPLVKNLSYEYIKISDGCSNNCSYCAIPLIRGPIKCFDPQNIIRDCKESISRGAKELVIIAQDIAVYNYDDYDLAKLLEEICNLSGDFWVRLLYCHPDHLTDRIIDVIANQNKIVHYLDIPFQHVSEKILKLMNRVGNYEIYKDLILKLRKKIPGIVIRTTFMTGFPGETEEDFKLLMKFLNEMQLDKVGCFIYSPEENTVSANYENVDYEIRKERHKKIMLLQKDISQNILKKMVGRKIRAIVEEIIDDDNFIARSEFDAPEVDGVFYLTGSNPGLNSFIEAEVVDSIEYDLIGEI